MAARSPARFLAPVALLGFVVALLLVVTHSSGGGSSGNSATTNQERPANSTSGNGGGKSSSAKGPRYYRVKPGDTPTSIAAKTGVSLSQIEQLNPNLDPQTLNPGERIKLRR
jgi:LysM repeat protein